MSSKLVVGDDVNFTTLTLSDVSAGLEAAGREVHESFGGLDVRQLNWRPNGDRWSIAQCFDHLLTANRLMFHAAEAALTGRAPRTVWQRVPLLPAVLGRMLIRSQSPQGARKWTAPTPAIPASSGIGPDILRRFLDQQHEAVSRLQDLDQSHAARVIMTSPFISVVTYSVLDGWRLVLAHERRHMQQARGILNLLERSTSPSER